VSHAARAEPVAIPWPTRPLAELAETFSDGDWIESKDQSPSGVRLLQTGNVGKGEFKDRGEKARFISADTFARLNCTEVFEGDILVSRLPDPVGRACIVPESDERMITAVDCSIVRLDKRQILPKLFVYFTQSDAYLSAVAALCTGTTRSRISRSALGRIEVPLPPLDEQKRIVAALDQAFAALDRARASAATNLADAHELFQRTLSASFDEENALAVEMRCLFDIGSSKRVLKAQWVSEGVPFYRGREVTALSRDGSVDNQLFITEEHFAELEERYGVPTAGDILITAIGTIGNAYIVQDRDRFYFKDASVLWMKKCSDVSSDYVLAWLRSPHFFDQLDTGNGATVDTLTIQKLQSIKIPLPACEQQERIVARLDAMRAQFKKLQSTYEQQLDDIDALRQSLLQAAFTGQLS
jgi:type I restriction enzyme S subunit